MSDRRFFGREAELSKLDDVWNREGFQFVAVWGRRRVGKTSILQEFCKRRKAILFPASASDLRTNLERLTEATAGVLMPGMPLPPFTDFRNAMLFISSFSKTERLALVIDEYPYLVGKNQSIQTDLQNLMHHELSDTNLMIVLAGSSMSFMEHQVLGYESPLYGRRTAQIEVEPFTYRETCGFLRDYSPEDCLTAYAVTGGSPRTCRSSIRGWVSRTTSRCCSSTGRVHVRGTIEPTEAGGP